MGSFERFIGSLHQPHRPLWSFAQTEHGTQDFQERKIRMKRNAIINAVRFAGIVDSGDGKEPAYRKLMAKADTVIANGVDAEPLLATNTTLLQRRPDLVVDGLKLAMKATRAQEGILAISASQPLLESLSQALPSDGSISIFAREQNDPAGDEIHLVYDAKKRVIPQGGVPEDAGVVVCNVSSLAQMARAVSGKAVTEKLVSVVGEVHNPKVVKVPIGTTYESLLHLAGGTTHRDVTVLDGGPLRGVPVQDLQHGITRTTHGITVLSSEHSVVQTKRKTTSEMLRAAKTSCTSCMRCTDMCPRYLAGHDIVPHQMMQALNHNQIQPQHLASSFLCTNCGVCDMLACDVMKLSPRQFFAETRNELLQQGLAPTPKSNSSTQLRSTYHNAKMSQSMLLKKLNLQRYQRKLPYEGMKRVGWVRVPLGANLNISVAPQVQLGERVRMGDVIAQSPWDQWGIRYHASIAGKVSDICNNWIEIRAR